MKALSLTQPWASLVALGHKHIETRSWTTSYRGPIAIHAAKGYPAYAKAFSHEAMVFGWLRPESFPLPLGAVVATARLARVERAQDVIGALSDDEYELGDYETDRFAWFLEDVKPLAEPMPAKGALGLWDWLAPSEIPA